MQSEVTAKKRKDNLQLLTDEESEEEVSEFNMQSPPVYQTSPIIQNRNRQKR